LAKEITKNAPPKAFTICRRMLDSYVGQGTPASGIRSAARTLFSSIRTGCTIYLVTHLDAEQILSASSYTWLRPSRCVSHHTVLASSLGWFANSSQTFAWQWAVSGPEHQHNKSLFLRFSTSAAKPGSRIRQVE